jgi:hypothetical protein
MTKRSDYYLFTFATNDRPDVWAWEIKRRGKPIDFRYTESGFESQASAEIAGNQELEEFLEALAKEEKRKR